MILCEFVSSAHSYHSRGSCPVLFLPPMFFLAHLTYSTDFNYHLYVSPRAAYPAACWMFHRHRQLDMCKTKLSACLQTCSSSCVAYTASGSTLSALLLKPKMCMGVSLDSSLFPPPEVLSACFSHYASYVYLIHPPLFIPAATLDTILFGLDYYNHL